MIFLIMKTAASMYGATRIVKDYEELPYVVTFGMGSAVLIWIVFLLSLMEK